MDLSDPAKKATATRELVVRTLQNSYPDATQEEIDSIGLQHFEELVNAILDVNNLEGKKKLQQSPGEEDQGRFLEDLSASQPR